MAGNAHGTAEMDFLAAEAIIKDPGDGNTIKPIGSKYICEIDNVPGGPTTRVLESATLYPLGFELLVMAKSPVTGTITVNGSDYEDVGDWEQLRVGLNSSGVKTWLSVATDGTA